MPQVPTPEELIEIAYRYFPAGMSEDDPRFLTSPEQQRLAAARRAADEDRGTWDAILASLRALLQSSIVDDWSFVIKAGHDACYTARIMPPDVASSSKHDDVVVMVSFVAPIYFIYSSINRRVSGGRSPRILLPSWTRRTHEKYAKAEEIVRNATGYSRPAASTLFRILPDIDYGNRWFGRVRLVDCLFSAHRW